jgi:peptidoglycan/xylan/chitin deacetylase (PgdA/CDA1 family)
MRYSATILLLLAITMSAAHAQTLALTFDDGLDPRTQPEAATWNTSLLESLAKAKVTGMLLPACKRVASADGMQLVCAWGRAGHAIGNHTYSHWNLVM